MRKLFLLMLFSILMVKIAVSQVNNFSKKDSTAKDSTSLKVDTNLIKADTNKPAVDTIAPKADTNMPEIDINAPKVDTNKPKAGTKTPTVGTKTSKTGAKATKPGTKTTRPGTKATKPGTKATKPGTTTPKVDTKSTKIDTLPKADTSLPKTDTVPKADTSLPKTDTVPKADTSLPKVDTLPKTDTISPKTDTRLIKPDTSKITALPAGVKSDSIIQKEDTSKSYFKIGLGPGIAKNSILGTYYDPVNCGYLFIKGTSYDTSINLTVSIPLDSTFELYFMAGYKIRGLNMTTQETRLRTVRGERDKVPVNMEAELFANFKYLDFNAFLRAEILFDHFYVMGGFGVSYNLSSELLITETIKDDRYLFGNNYLPWTFLYSKNDFPDINKLNYSANLGLSYELFLTNDLFVAATGIFSYSFTNVDTKNTLKLNSLILMINLGYKF